MRRTASGVCGHGFTFSPGTPKDAERATSASTASRPISGSPARSHRKNSTLPEGPAAGWWSRPGHPSHARAAASATASTASARCAEIAHDSALAQPLLADLELRLDHQHQVPVGAVTPISASSTSCSEMKDRSPTTRSTGPPIRSVVDLADVGAVVDPHAGVVAQRPDELAVADVHGDHLARRRRAAARR